MPANDENSTDEEMHQNFTSQGLTKEQADAALSIRYDRMGRI